MNMNRKKIYFQTFLFLILAMIAMIAIAISSEYLPLKKYIDPIGHLLTIGPGIIALLFIIFNKKDDFSLLVFRRFNVWVLLELIGVYVIVCLIEIFVQLKLGNIKVVEHISNNQIFDISVNPIFYILISCIFFFCYAGLGEEIAWRGYIFSKFKKLSYLEITFVINIVWALWHFPMFAFGAFGKNDLGFRFIMFMLMCVEFGIFLNYLRIRTNSIWGAVILHPMTNIFSYILSSYFVINNNFWGTHPNLIVVLCLLPFSVIYYIKGKKYFETYQTMKYYE